MALADLTIDDLVVRVPGLSRAQGHRLAGLIRERLALKAATGAVPTHMGRLAISLPSGPALPLEELADRIVAKLAARLGLEG